MSGRLAKTLKSWGLIAFSLMLLSCDKGNAPAPKELTPSGLMPGPPLEWRETGKTRTFSGVALSDHINGGAEAYLAYGFREVAVREFRDSGGARLIVEIYQMDAPENAYGIFSTDSVGEHWPIGADASYGGGLLRFWKGPYFVRIMSFPPNPLIETAIRETGKRIADAIAEESRRPRILRVLPETGVLPDTVCYFHRQTSLNNIRFLSDENLLHLNDTVSALTWEEKVSDPKYEGGRLRQMAIRYPSGLAAEAALEDFSSGYMKAGARADASAAVPLVAVMPDGTCSAAVRRAQWVAVVLDAPSSDSAAGAVRRTQAKMDALDKREESP